MIPKLFEIPIPFFDFSIPIYSFGTSMLLAFLAAWRLLALNLERRGEPPALAERMITWGAIGGLVGAKAAYILTFPTEVLRAPLRSIFSGAGFVFYGGFIAGAFAVWLLLRLEKKPFLLYADLTAPVLALGYAVGRIGCQLSGDGDYGKPSALPWAMGYPQGVVPTPPGVTVHPTPVYETILSLLITLLLLWLLSRKTRFSSTAGQVFGVYLVLSALARFFVEFIRIEPIVLFSLTEAQFVALVLLIPAGLWLTFRPFLTEHPPSRLAD